MLEESPSLIKFNRLAWSLVVLTFVLVVVGVIVRSTGSGLGCGTTGNIRDWPLCQGGLLPPAMVEAVVEFSHRLLAAGLAVGLLAALVWVAVDPLLRRKLGAAILVATLLLGVQIGLGAVTVRLLLPDRTIDPNLIVLHLATAMAFFGVLVVIARQSQPMDSRGPAGELRRPTSLFPLAVVSALGVYVQTLLGGLVASHNAGLACPDFPGCYGKWLWRLEGPLGLQEVHRLGAYGVFALVLAFAYFAAKGGLAWKKTARLAAALVVLQSALGIANVILGLPLLVRAAHHAVAFALFGVMVAALFDALQQADLAPALLWLPGSRASGKESQPPEGRRK